MKHLILPFFAATVFLTACGGGDHQGTKERAAKGPVHLGGVFRINEVEDFRTLYPLNIGEEIGFQVAGQVYEGLVKLNQKDLSVIPCLADKYEINEDATKFVFHIRKGVMFQDDPCFPNGKGREVKAGDFKWCFDKLCEMSPNNNEYIITFKNRVVGADEYFESTSNKKPLPGGVSGVKVIDDYTLEIDLKQSFAGFLNILITPGCWLFPKEALDKYKDDLSSTCVGTGPFRAKSIKRGEYAILERNEKYWDVDQYGNQLPYLDVLHFTFIKDKKAELLKFRSKELDMIFRVPVEMIPSLMGELKDAKAGGGDFDIQSVAALRLTYYGFQALSAPFNNVKVRQAFNYAIDRRKLVTYTLQGDGEPGEYGIVPPAFKKFDTTGFRGFHYNPEKAKKLLAEAGFPDGKGFEPIALSINSDGGDRNQTVAEVVTKMLKENLNVDVRVDQMPRAQHIENMESGKTKFFRASWVADYPDPETFLDLLDSKSVPARLEDKSYVNFGRYKSARFDSLFNAAKKEIDSKKRFDLYKQADQTIIDDAAIMPIYYEEIDRLLQKNVRDFDANAMEYRDMSKVWLDVDKAKK
ncbi:MAG TPA: ABC transporter substrate-binding protein [Bacteroidia bacterium]|jgi:peptide/nickel transport system substrate-binding protein|nr:ABC transporter substrate-binding protein [Bacteroidia bacterium]